jgi:hypothetical protein
MPSTTPPGRVKIVRKGWPPQPQREKLSLRIRGRAHKPELLAASAVPMIPSIDPP